MQRLTRYFGDIDTQNSQKIIALFERYYKQLLEWNQKINLTAITEREDVIIKHFADSLEGLGYTYGKICDLGSGAGFPGIPFALVDNSKEIVLLDSVAKKVTFLQEMIDLFGLNVTAKHIRIEDAARTSYREHFDTVVARAVAPLPTLAEYALPLLKVGGQAIIYKGDAAEKEIADATNALSLLNAEVKEIKKYNLLNTDIQRTLILIYKKSATPIKYPRQGNKPRTNPL